MKGYRRFIGFGIITKTEVRQEFDPSGNGVFSNYLFEVSLFQIPPEGIDWGWIADRRDESVPEKLANRKAPPSWKTWVREGMSSVDGIRQQIRHYKVSEPKEQIAELSKSHREVLDAVVSKYPQSTDKGRFESLASLASQVYFGEHYDRGWITKHSGDMGVDFVGCLDIRNHLAPSPAGTVLGGAKVLVLGQAKCRTDYCDGKKAENARDIARVAARLQRGHIGLYVTTGTYKVSTQKEVAIDGYPIVLINGRQFADLLIQYRSRTGKEIEEIVDECDRWYEENQKDYPPEFALRDSKS